MRTALVFAQAAEDDGIDFTPDSSVEALVYLVFLAALVWLWIVVRRTRDKADEQYLRRAQLRRQGKEPSRRAAPSEEVGMSIGDRVTIMGGEFDGSTGVIEGVDPFSRLARVRVSSEPRPVLIELSIEALEPG